MNLEKGKGPVLGKLWFITLIEADLQIGIRIVLDSRNEELIEKDQRFSKANCGSQKNYAIESAILEKRLTLDNSLNTLKHLVRNFTDLKSCYDGQLSNLGSIIEESVGRKRNPMVSHTKIMPKFRKFVSAGHGISEEYYSSKRNNLAWVGQGNKFTRDTRKDVSCLIIKELENKGFRIEIKSHVSNKKELCAAVTFGDDIDLIEDGPKAEENMQKNGRGLQRASQHHMQTCRK